MQALGYRQVVEYLEGARSLSETMDLVKSRTRQYAKRQMTWFTRQCAADWIRVEPASSVAEVVAEAVCRWERTKALYIATSPVRHGPHTTKGLGSFASEHLASGHETQEYENDGDRNEQEKEELGDIRGSSGHSGKAQHGCNDSDDKKYGCPPQHNVPFNFRLQHLRVG